MLLQNILRTMGVDAAADEKPMIEDLFATTLYSGTGAARDVVTGVQFTNLIPLKGRAITNLGGAFDAALPISKINDGILETTPGNNTGFVPQTSGYFDVMVDLVSPSVICEYKIAPQGYSGSTSHHTPTSFIVKASNDGTNWSTITTFSNISIGYPSWNPGTYRSFVFTNSTAYRYWRLQNTTYGSTSQGVSISEWALATNAEEADGLIWLKSRSAATDHALYDTVRGATYDIASNLSTAQTTQTTGLTSFNADGFSLGTLAKLNTSAATYAAWTFKKRAKFFDVVQFTAGSSTNRRISHSLGCVPGMIVIRSVGSDSWFAYHRNLGLSKYLLLNLTNAQNTSITNAWGTSDPTTTDFGIKETSLTASGQTYICYLFAHDDSADSVIKCGSFTTDASGNATVNLGWEPQYVMLKVSSTTGNWITVDNMRGMPVGSNDQQLYPNLANAETAAATLSPTATGFDATTLTASQTYIYLAIRRGPMRVPTDGTKVYNAIARTGTGAAATVTGVGFAPDFVMSKSRNAGYGACTYARLQGVQKALTTTAGIAEYADSTGVTFFGIDGISVATDTGLGGVNHNVVTYITNFFRRAPGFFDIVCDTGTGAAHTVTHNLMSVPGMIWRKGRSGATQWEVWHRALAASEKLVLNTTDIKATDATAWNSTAPTASVFSVGTGANVNTSAATYVTYLFGDTPGLCKSGNYTGNGTNQDVACGFAPRFVIIKRTDATGNWVTVDSTRGIVSGADPSLLLNSTVVEVTSIDFIDPIATGFNIAQEATNNLNVNGASYIFWASS